MAEKTVLCMLWSIREFGKPTTEGEFCSLHIDADARDKFFDQYWAKMPKEPVPETYACVAEVPDSCYECLVDETTYRRVLNSGIGMWAITVPSRMAGIVSLIPPRDLVSLYEGMS